MPTRSLSQRLRAVEDVIEGPARYQDLALALRRAKTRETLLFAGGRWDLFDRRFDAERPEKVVTIYLEESQVEFTRWFASFLADYRDGYPRDISLALAAGDRRGGKTFDTFFCLWAALIDVPMLPPEEKQPTIGWVISRTHKEREELDILVSTYLPGKFYRRWKAPEQRFLLPHGAILRNLSADDPESLKQGRVDWLLYNEPQKMSARAVKNGLYGTADAGGLCILSANPPSGPEGEWLVNLKEGIEEDPEIKPLSVFFNFSSKDNTKIDQPARARVAKLAHKIDPEGSEADAEGVWKRWGDHAYPAWDKRPLDKGGLVGPVPQLGARDLTSEITERIFWKGYPLVVGGDFQKRPHEAAVILRIFEGPAGPIYWFTDEAFIRGDEFALSAAVIGRGVLPGEAMWIADCSGSYQGADRIPGRTSYGMLEEHGWHVEPAEIIKIPEKSDHPKNPDVGARLTLMLRLMEQRRIRVDPRCAWLIEAFTKCQLTKAEYGRRYPKGKHAHITDAACYPIWRMEPKPGDVRDWNLDGFGPLANFRRGGSPFPTRR